MRVVSSASGKVITDGMAGQYYLGWNVLLIPRLPYAMENLPMSDSIGSSAP
jgi:hypothetical protein